MRDPMSDAGLGVESNGGKTGWPPGMLQDDSRELSKWLAERPGARWQLDDVYTEPGSLPEDGSQSWLGVVIALATIALVALGACLAIWWPA